MRGFVFCDIVTNVGRVWVVLGISAKTRPAVALTDFVLRRWLLRAMPRQKQKPAHLVRVFAVVHFLRTIFPRCYIYKKMDIFNKFGVVREEGLLANGIPVVLYKRPGAPIAISAVFRSGSRYDPLSMPGVAHFMEHMIVGGSPEFPTKDLLAEHIESVGGSYGARTGQDALWVDVEVAERGDFARAVDIFNATLCNPLLDKRAFENEKQVIQKEIQKSNSNPAQILGKTSRELFFEGTPFEHAILGDEQTILGLDYDNAIREYQKLFDASRALFVASGDILLEEIVERLNLLNFLTGNNFDVTNESFNICAEEKVRTTFFDAPQTYIAFGVRAPRSYTKEATHLSLLGQILAGGRASRLAKRLRYEKGLVYGVGATRFGGVDFGSWAITTDTSDNKVEEVVECILREIDDVRRTGVKDSELEFVKNKIVKSLRRNMQTSSDWVEFHSTPELFTRGAFTLEEHAMYVSEASVDDLQKIAREYFSTERWQLALCGRTKNESMRFDLS